MNYRYHIRLSFSITTLFFLLLTSPITAKNTWSLDENLPTTQNYFSKWIAKKDLEGYDFIAVKSSNNGPFVIAFQQELPGLLEDNLITYQLIGTNHLITRVEVQLYCPTIDDPYQDITPALSFIETDLSNLIGTPISLSKQERTQVAAHAIERSSYFIAKPLYTLEVLDYDTPSSYDFRPSGSVDLALTLNQSVSIDIKKPLDTLPYETTSLSLLKKLGFSSDKISREIHDLGNARSFYIQGKNPVVKQLKPQFISFNVIYEVIADSSGTINTQHVPPSYCATWSVDMNNINQNFDQVIAQLKKDVLRVQSITSSSGKPSDLDAALTSIRPWLTSELIAIHSVPYYKQKHMFPLDYKQVNQYDYTLFAESNDDETALLITIYFE